MMKPATLAPLTVRVRRMPKRISGSGCRSSQTTKAASRTTDAAITPSVSADSQPWRPACVIA